MLRQNHVGGVPISHSPKFCYLGSVISESRGVSVESTTCMGKAVVALNRISKYWSSPASVHAKCRVLNSRVLPDLGYAAECGNHVQANLKSIDVFLNSCRNWILSLPKWRRGWRRQRADLLRRKCPLASPLGLISPGRLAFVCKLMLRPGCEVEGECCSQSSSCSREQLGMVQEADLPTQKFSTSMQGRVPCIIITTH
jgi:hypothetical protein